MSPLHPSDHEDPARVVQVLRRRYQEARRQFRARTDHQPPALRDLVQMAAKLYVNQATSYEKQGMLYCPEGVLPKVVARLEQAAPEVVVADDERRFTRLLEPGETPTFYESLMEIASYVCLRALTRARSNSIDELIEDPLRLGEQWKFEEQLALHLARYTRGCHREPRAVGNDRSTQPSG